GGMAGLYGGPRKLGEKLRRQVLDETGLSVSVGLASNRMLAKIAARLAKPGKVCWISPDREQAALSALPVESLPGVGPKTAAILRDLNITTAGHLRVLPRTMLAAMLGRRGELLYERCRGRDFTPIRPDNNRKPKTISRETTFHEPTCDPTEIRGMLSYLLGRAMRTARGLGLLVGAVELTIRYDDWKHFRSRRSLKRASADDQEIFAHLSQLLEQLFTRRVALRHVGLALSKLSGSAAEATLFDRLQRPSSRDERKKTNKADATRLKKLDRRNLTRAIDAIRRRWGHSALVTGEAVGLIGKLQKDDYGFVLRTPSLTK
ncbi:MAG: hypothetical protein J7M14_08235, partial [Planctomycetes bacterium]|nr:hypothetical protein [Planctomycetota bacterium]